VERGRVQVTSAEQGQAERLLEAGDRLTVAPPANAADSLAPSLLDGSAEPGDEAALRFQDEPARDEAVHDETAQDEAREQREAVQGETAEPARSRRLPKAADAEPTRRAREEARVPAANERTTSLRGGPTAPAKLAPPLSEGGEPKPTSDQWKRLAQAGRYADAVVEARGLGVDSLLQSASASDLLLLADAARLSSAAALAEQALLAIRKRFPKHPNAEVASFALGRLAFEVRRDDRAAVRWFEAYLQSSPSGAMHGCDWVNGSGLAGPRKTTCAITREVVMLMSLSLYWAIDARNAVLDLLPGLAGLAVAVAGA
jgi:hypothetical protein